MLWMFTLAFRNLWRQRQRTLLTASAIGLGLALFLFLLGYIEGLFVQAVEVSAGGFLGDAQLHHRAYRAEREQERVLPDGPRALEAARATPGVLAAAPRQYVLALAAMGDRSANVQVIGVDLAEEPKVTLFHRKLLHGSWPVREGQALLGHELATRLELGVGDKLVLTAADARTGELRSVLVRVSGLIASGNALLDREAVVTSLPQAGALSGQGGELHEVALKLAGPNTDPAVLDAALLPLSGALGPDVEVAPWQRLNALLWTAYQFQRNLIYLLALAVFGVASFSIVNTLRMSFAERLRELGVLRALGTSPARLAALLLCESTALGLLGAAAGCALGFALCAPFAIWGMPIEGMEFSGVYVKDAILFRPKAAHALTLAPLFAGLTALTGLFAAVRAARLRPVEALNPA